MAGRGAGDLCEKSLEATLCWTRPIPASPSTDPLQNTAEPCSKSGGTSVKAHLRRGRECWREREEEAEGMREKNKSEEWEMGCSWVDQAQP